MPVRPNRITTIHRLTLPLANPPIGIQVVGRVGGGDHGVPAADREVSVQRQAQPVRAGAERGMEEHPDGPAQHERVTLAEYLARSEGLCRLAAGQGPLEASDGTAGAQASLASGYDQGPAQGHADLAGCRPADPAVLAGERLQAERARAHCRGAHRGGHGRRGRGRGRGRKRR